MLSALARSAKRHSPKSLALLALACTPAASSPPEVVIQAADYSFQMPSELPAGTTLFRLDNRGKVAHEVAMGRLREGVTADSVLAYLGQGRDPGPLTDGVVGVLIAEAGTSALGALKTDLVSGRTYMMICQFQDADSLPPHVAMGMQASFVAQ